MVFDLILSSDDLAGVRNCADELDSEVRMQTTKSYSVAEVCAVTSLGRTLIFSEISDGSLKAKKVGRRTIILESDLSAWLSSRADAKEFNGLISPSSNGKGMS